MLFMIIERFADSDMVPIYQRLQDEGRGVSEGLRFVDSWVEAGFSRCFQIMECDDLGLLQQWVLHWRGLKASFEIIPVVPGHDAARRVQHLLASDTTKG